MNEECFTNSYPAIIEITWDTILNYLNKPGKVPGTIVFSSVEQGIVFGKAIKFGDIKTANKILETNNLEKIRQLGEKVAHFHQLQWDAIKTQYIKVLIYAKFRQNKDLRRFITNYDCIRIPSGVLKTYLVDVQNILVHEG